MNREVHVRIWERPEVRALRATRHDRLKAPVNLYNRKAACCPPCVCRFGTSVTRFQINRDRDRLS